MYPIFKASKKSKKKKCVIYEKTDGTYKELNLKVHRSFLLFRYFNNKIPESVSPLIPTTIPIKEMNLIYKCVLFSYLSYKDRTKIIFPPEIKIEYENFESDVRRIPFFIATDSTTNSIIVSCRGSTTKDDFITDSLGNGVTYRGGKFHEGIFSTASYVFLTCQNKVIELNNLYNSEDDENLNDDSESDSNISDIDYSDYDDEEEEEEEEDMSEKHFSLHKSNSNDELNLLTKSAISLQRSTSSEELNLQFHSISNSNLNPSMKNKKEKSKFNLSDHMSDENKKSIRKSISTDELRSQKSGSLSMQKSMSNDDLHLNYDSIPNSKKVKSNSNDDDDSDNNSDSSENTNSMNDNSYKNKNKIPLPISAPKQLRRSTSEEKFNIQQNEMNKTSHKKSNSIANLHNQFQKLTEKKKNNSIYKADSETEKESNSPFVNKMRKKRTKIIITGHSLGASVAAVVAYLFREKFPELDVQCICFAPPPTLSFNVWRKIGKYVKSFMIEGDVVPFLSVRNLLTISDIMFPHQHSNKKFKKLIISYLEKKSLEKFHVNKALSEKLYPPGQMYLIRFTDDNEGGISTLRKRIKKLREKRKKRRNLDDDDIKDDKIQLCQILNPDYFSNLVKNIQENNHAVKNYMRLIIRLIIKFKKQLNHQK